MIDANSHFINLVMQSKIKKLLFEVQFDNESSPYKGKLQPDLYLNKFMSFRQSIIQNLQEYIPVEVVPKAPPRYYSPLLTKGANNLYHDLKHNKLAHFPRKGAFQITIDNYLVFSRLQTDEWPNVQQLTQWAFKVAQKMLDFQIQKETHLNKIQNQENESSEVEGLVTHKKYSNPHEGKQKQSSQGNVALQQRLPKLTAGGDQRNSITSNYTTLPVKPGSKHSRYLEKHNEREELPHGFQSKDFQKTQHAFRQSEKLKNNTNYRLAEKKQTLYYTDSKPRSKQQSFHWNLGTPRNLSLGRSTVRINGDNFRQSSYRGKNIDLQPIRKDTRVQRDKIQSQKVNAKIETEEKIQKIQLRVSQSVLNTYRMLYEVQGNGLTKKYQGGKWSPVLCQNIFPLKGQSFFSVGVIRSLQNMIIIGIAPLSYYPNPQKDQENDQLFICYNCSNGMIKDSKLNEQSQSTSWRLGGDSAPRRKPYQLRVTVDMDAKYIDWYIEETIVASSKISKPFIQGFRVIVSLFNLQDSVILNEQDWKDKIRVSKFNNLNYYLPRNENGQSKTNEDPNKVDYKPKEVYQLKLGQILMDQSVQTDSFGRIKKQRIVKLIDKKKGLQSANQNEINYLQQSQLPQQHQLSANHLSAQTAEDKRQISQPHEQQMERMQRVTKVIRKNIQHTKEKSTKVQQQQRHQKRQEQGTSKKQLTIPLQKVSGKHDQTHNKKTEMKADHKQQEVTKSLDENFQNINKQPQNKQASGNKERQTKGRQSKQNLIEATSNNTKQLQRVEPSKNNNEIQRTSEKILHKQQTQQKAGIKVYKLETKESVKQKDIAQVPIDQSKKQQLSVSEGANTLKQVEVYEWIAFYSENVFKMKQQQKKV